MELQGKVIAETPERSGSSARGEWKAKDFVIETHDTYPRKMVFSVFGDDRLQRFDIKLGDEILVSFDIDAKEYNGRWFNNVRAYDVKKLDATQINNSVAPPFESAPQMSAPISTPNPFPPQPSSTDENTADDLPF